MTAFFGRQFTFNGDNKQVEVRNSANQVVGEYKYDGLGKRIKKETATEYVVLVYDGLGKLIGEYSADGPPAAPTVNYTATDPLGSPRVLTNKQGEVVSRRDFMPFGEEIVAMAETHRTPGDKYGLGDGVRQKFTGYERDNEINLDFAEARYYNPMHGRFTSPDDFFNDTHVSEPQSWNLYAYVRNNPLVFVDPTGMRATDFIDIGTGDRVHIDDGKDQVIAAQSADIAQFQKEINSDRAAYDERLRVFENSANNLHMNTAQFNDLAGVIYAEASNNATWQESAGIHGVLRNRAAADGNSVLDQANDTSQVFGANDKGKIFSPNASQSKVNAVYKGIALSVVTGKDISNGAYYWHGTDFRRPTAGSKAHERFYKTGFQFTSPSHNIWNLPDKKSGSRKYDFKYESTGAQGQTTFMKLTQAWMKANGATRWNGK
ncbi:MAG: RHS repeat-associated core domain-containing protein [Acidobacteriota bacterium]|nr:MAG: RHS repeat-associated core domain-containing protein [Acidobacteriota bacterium]